MRELKAAIDAKIEQLTGKLSNIAADVTRIKDSINPNGLTAEEAQDVVAKLDAALTQATDIDDSTPEPTEEPGTGVASSDEEVE